MGEINIPDDQQQVLAALDTGAVDRAIDHAISTERIGVLHDLRLGACGLYISGKLSSFERALRDHAQAKSGQKRERTGQTLQRAGGELSFAVSSMKHRLENDQKDRQLFEIEDRIPPPYSFSRHLSVLVHYRWRKNTDDLWQSGHITFKHTVVERPIYSVLLPKKKPSAAKREQELEQRCFEEWERLKSHAVYAVRDFFREGRSGEEIPDSFQLVTDHSGQLDNYSAEFWKKETG